MWIKTDFNSDRSYGGYQQRRFTATLTPDYDYLIDPNFIHFDDEPRYARQLRSVLLGKKADGPIKGWRSTIVYPGETIARLHISQIIESWGSLSGCPSIADDIDAVKRSYAADKRAASARRDEVSVTVRFDFTGEHGTQSGGSIGLSTPEARWLGEQLLLAVRGETEDVVAQKFPLKSRVIKKK